MNQGEQIENKTTTVMNSRDESSTAGFSKELRANPEASGKEAAVIVHTTRLTESIVFIAKIYVMNYEENWRVCRAILDSGSQSNIITKDLARKLKLKGNRVDVPISGISQTQITAKESTSIRIKSMHSEFSAELDSLIMPTITEKLPHIKVNTHNWDIPKELNLADPSFNLPGTIDILLGSSHFWTLMRAGQRELNDSLSRLQES